MPGSGTDYHEPASDLSPATRDIHRAIVSLIEELEAVDWYKQRAEACQDEDLAAILLHNMEEEMEHAMMCLEWLRRRLPTLDRMARDILFQDGPIRAPHGAAGESANGAEAGAVARGLGPFGER